MTGHRGPAHHGVRGPSLFSPHRGAAAMRLAPVVLLLCLSASACSSEAPAPPSIAGRWVSVKRGARVDLTLNDRGGLVHGTGGVNTATGNSSGIRATGHAVGAAVALELTRTDDGSSAMFQGTLAGDSLAGFIYPATSPAWPITFRRAP